MPNVACNTSSFLKSNCKYLRTVESREWKPAKPQEPIWDGAEIAVDGSFWENYVEAHTCLFNYRCVLEYVLELWTVKMSWYFIKSLTDELMLACDSSWQQVYESEKKVMLSDIDNGKKKPTENNQSKSIFQLVWFHVVALGLALVTILLTRNWRTTCSVGRTCPTTEWHWRLLVSYDALQGTEWQRVTPCHLWPRQSVWDLRCCRR